MPGSASGPIGGSASQRKKVKKHTAGSPDSPLNGRFDASDTNSLRVLLDDAAANGALELEPGSTNVLYGFGRRVGVIERYGQPGEDADGIRWVRSSNVSEPHFYPVSMEALGLRICRVCNRRIVP